MKRRGPGQEKVTYGGLSGALNGAGARTGAGAEGKKKQPRPGPWTGAGRGIGPGARWFRGPGGPVTNTSLCEELRPVGILGLLYHLEVPLPGESGEVHTSFRAIFLCHPAGLGVFFA